jgi:hypothetical protein
MTDRVQDQPPHNGLERAGAMPAAQPARVGDSAEAFDAPWIGAAPGERARGS